MNGNLNVPREAQGALVVLLALGLAVFLVVAGFAILRAQGPAQTCMREGGRWVQHYDSTSKTTNGWIDDHSCVK